MVELGRLPEATALLDAMRAAGHRPGFGAYHILIKHHAQRGDMDAARKLFAQLRAYRGSKPMGARRSWRLAGRDPCCLALGCGCVFGAG